MFKYQFNTTKLMLLILLTLPCFFSKAATDNQTCDIIYGKPLTSGNYGPFDYTNPENRGIRLSKVEDYHFTRNVELLIKGESGSIASDIQYTLRKFPNHHRALYSMIKHSSQQKLNYSRLFTTECLFKRALYFNPNDAIVYLLQGIYHHKKKSYDEAQASYLKALEIQPNNPEISYNLALFYFERDDFNNAKKYAQIAYKNGYPLQGLRNKLKSKNITID